MLESEMASASSPSLDVATPERVSLTLPVAGIGYRCLAWLVDATILFFFWVIAYFVFSVLVSDVLGLLQGLSGLVQTLLAVGIFATQWMYWTLSEVFLHGQTPGKRLLGIRVVRMDGSPVGLYESAMRNLLRAVDFLPAFYATGSISMLFTKQHRRLGDLLAGTLLVREELFNLDKYTAPAPASPETAAASGAPGRLASEEVELILAYLERTPWLEPDARRRLGLGLVERFGGLAEAERATVTASQESLEGFLRARAQGAR
ncbi:RDD family protein [Hyalangium minutum]|uniref:RDD family protein n=2 Tax=Hyalangium minutum TaxID=394096 RepID=A0A085WSY7_9BACT|nr:RDD family protein [Hyalangium minutum]